MLGGCALIELLTGQNTRFYSRKAFGQLVSTELTLFFLDCFDQANIHTFAEQEMEIVLGAPSPPSPPPLQPIIISEGRN